MVTLKKYWRPSIPPGCAFLVTLLRFACISEKDMRHEYSLKECHGRNEVLYFGCRFSNACEHKAMQEYEKKKYIYRSKIILGRGKLLNKCIKNEKYKQGHNMQNKT